MRWFDISFAIFALAVAIWIICITITEVSFIKRYLADKYFKLYNCIGWTAQILGVILVAVLGLALIVYLLALAYYLLTGVISIGGSKCG